MMVVSAFRKLRRRLASPIIRGEGREILLDASPQCKPFTASRGIGVGPVGIAFSDLVSIRYLSERVLQ
jgi:hypothetical protein